MHVLINPSQRAPRRSILAAASKMSPLFFLCAWSKLVRCISPEGYRGPRMPEMDRGGRPGSGGLLGLEIHEDKTFVGHSLGTCPALP